MLDLSPELCLQTRIIDRLKECRSGATIDNLAAFLGAPHGDVRSSLYDLADSKCVRFSSGMWRVD